MTEYPLLLSAGIPHYAASIGAALLCWHLGRLVHIASSGWRVFDSGQGFQTRQRLRGLSNVAISKTYQDDLDTNLARCDRLSAANHTRFGYTAGTYEMAVLARWKLEKPD